MLHVLWLLPVLIAIAIVVGAVGHDRPHALRRSIGHTFQAFLVGVLLLGLAVHLLSRLVV